MPIAMVGTPSQCPANSANAGVRATIIATICPPLKLGCMTHKLEAVYGNT